MAHRPRESKRSELRHMQRVAGEEWDLDRSRSPPPFKKPAMDPGHPTTGGDRAPVMPMQMGAPAHDGDGGSGGGGGGSGANIEAEMKFGQPCGMKTHHYKRSFLININNGKANFKCTEATAALGRASVVTWNEGWQIIPWNDLRAYLTPMDYFELTMMNRKWRVKSVKITMEGIIPFQVNLAGAANSTTATFNNRINIHTYVDDGELLPDTISLDPMAHNDTFTTPWGEGTTGLLKSPDFEFSSARAPSAYRYNVLNTLTTGKPQQFFSLYNTGRVKSIYPGQKFERSWENPFKSFVGRPTNDITINSIDITAAPLVDIDELLATYHNSAYRAGITGHQGNQLKQTPSAGPTFDVTQKSRYVDTGIPMKFEGPPYVLVRVEPYPDLGTAGGLLDMYAQAHLHYEMVCEAVPLEKPTTYVPLFSGRAATQGTAKGMARQINNDTCYGVTDNQINRHFGVGDDDSIYT